MPPSTVKIITADNSTICPLSKSILTDVALIGTFHLFMIKFQETGLKPELLKAIADLGFENPTPIQVETLSLLDEKPEDFIALAQTGTGKTAAFGLPLAQYINPKDNDTQALILCPTRELCLQITDDLQQFTKYLPKLHVTAIYGGAPIYQQEKQLGKGSQIVVGTPGRVIDMINRRALSLDKVQWFILDEADEMLNMGFKDDLETIFKETPKDKSTWLFSATMPPKVESIAQRYMNTARRISVGKRNEGAANVSHEYYMVNARDRFEALQRIVSLHDEFYGVVFCRTRQETTDVANKLISLGYPAEAISGALSQQQRDRVMGKFRKRQLKLLIATDVAARGIDVDNLTHVINYQLPDDPEVYVHRSGRTGRAGKSGVSVSIVHGRQKSRIRELEKMTGKSFTLRKVPTMEEVAREKVLAMTKEMSEASVKGKGADGLLTEVYLMFEGMSRDQIIEQFALWSYNTVRESENGHVDINIEPGTKDDKADRGTRSDRENRRESRERRGRGDDDSQSFTRVDFNIGSKQSLNPGRLMGMINEVMNNSSINFGKIEIGTHQSAIDIDSRYAPEVAIALEGLQFGSRNLQIVLGDKPLGQVGRPGRSGAGKRSGGKGKPAYTTQSQNKETRYKKKHKPANKNKGKRRTKRGDKR